MASAEPDTIVIDHSSVPPDATRSFAQQASACSARTAMLDAPVSGGPAAAAAGKMIVWAGGEERIFARARPWIEAYAARVHHMGATGSGQIAKACHQIVACGSVVLWEEALRLASACGLDPAQVADAMDGAAADSQVRRTFARGLAAGDFPLASLANMTKDLCAIQLLAKEHGAAAALSQAALEQFRTRITDLAMPAGPSSSHLQESGS